MPGVLTWHAMFRSTGPLMYQFEYKCWLCPCRRENHCVQLYNVQMYMHAGMCTMYVALILRPAHPNRLRTAASRLTRENRLSHIPQTRENSHILEITVLQFVAYKIRLFRTSNSYSFSLVFFIWRTISPICQDLDLCLLNRGLHEIVPTFFIECQTFVVHTLECGKFHCHCQIIQSNTCNSFYRIEM